jgi:deazaflavin-dependent oxidoreductase (nitroreductase family)
MLDPATAERDFFRALNPLVERWARAGCASPSRWPFGLIVLETTGRRSGQTRSVPILAMLIEDHVIIATARGERSQWFKNLQASPDVRYWIDGELRDARAIELTAAAESPPPNLPHQVHDAVVALTSTVGVFGFRLALLVPSS